MVFLSYQIFHHSSCTPRLKLEDLLLRVAQLLQDTGQLALVGRAVLGATDGLVHAGRSADEDLDVLLLGLGQDGLQELLADVALAAGPLLGRVVQDVEGTEAAGVGVLELLEFLLQEDVLLLDVTEHQGDLGLVLGVLEDLTRKLVHGGDTGTTSDQANVVVLVGLPGVLDDRTLEVQALADVHAVQVLGHGSVGVDLDDKVDVTGGFCAKSANVQNVLESELRGHTLIAGRGVRANDSLGVGGLELGQEGSCRFVSKKSGWFFQSKGDIQATWRPERASLSSNSKRRRLVLWFRTSISDSFRSNHPWSPPLKTLGRSIAAGASAVAEL